MEKTSRIFVTGHRGLVGSSLMRRLLSDGYTGVITRSRSELDLCHQSAVQDFFRTQRIEYLFHCAARVGGIEANRTKKADFLYENLAITTNVLRAAFEGEVKKVVNLGSSCVYPREAPQPMTEDCLLDGKPEPTNEGYAIAKIAGLKLCQYYHEQYGCSFVSVMPSNLYGIDDQFDSARSHVIPGLLRRFHQARLESAKQVSVWGSGRPRREFLYVDDLTDALMLVMERYDSSQILNLGFGSDVTIRELTEQVKHVTNYAGDIYFDTSKPDGMPRKFLNSDRAFTQLGWKPKISLEEGLTRTYHWALQNERL